MVQLCGFRKMLCFNITVYLVIPSDSFGFVCVFQLSELALEIIILYYGGHLVASGQITSGTFFSFFIYLLNLGECLEVIIVFN